MSLFLIYDDYVKLSFNKHPLTRLSVKIDYFIGHIAKRNIVYRAKYILFM